MRRNLWIVSLLAGTIVALNACGRDGDSPVFAREAPRLAIGAGASHLGDISRTCSLYYAEHGNGHGARIWTKRVTLYFPRSEVPRSGAVRMYSYRGYASGPNLAVYADCLVPATAAAVRRMDRIFGVRRATQPDDPATTMRRTCIVVREDGTCELAPVVGTACQNGGDYPDCSPLPGDFETCGMLGTCGGGGWPSGPLWPGGGGGWMPAQDDGTGRPECTRTSDSSCVTRPVRTTVDPGQAKSEWQRLGEQIAKISENSPECKGAKQALLALYSQGPGAGRFRFWDGYDIRPQPDGSRKQRYGQNLSDQFGRFIEYDGYWALADAVYVVHEGLHLFLHLTNSPLMGHANEDWVDAVEETCV